MVGLTDNSAGGISNSSGYLRFDSRKYFRLVSVLVYPMTAGNRTIELRTSSGTVLQSKTINLPIAAGGMRVYLNFDVPVGNDLQLGLSAGSGSFVPKYNRCSISILCFTNRGNNRLLWQCW